MIMKRLVKVLTCLMVIFYTFASSEEQYATILKTTGKVNIRTAKQTSFSIPAKMSMGLMKDDAIRTEEDGFAAIVFNTDKSLVKIRKNSEMEIKEDYAGRTIKMNQGRILVNITPGVMKSYRVETPTSVASVKGTKFWVLTDQYGDRFYGIEGTVEIMNLITGIESMMQAGQMVISTTDGQIINLPVEPQDIPKDEDESVIPEPPVPPKTEETVSELTSEMTTAAAIPVVKQGEKMPKAEGKKAGGKPFGMGLGLGSVTIDGKIYNQLAFRPELRLGKLGIGLDVAIYMDEQGNIRKEEWDEFSDYLDKVYYVRWAQQGDPFFAKAGALDNVSMGYGILINGYSNTMEYPQVRKVGVHTGMQFDKLGWEAFIANLKEITGPGLIGGRVTYKPLNKFPLVLGGTLVMDVNQYKGLKDTDGDYYPDAFDAFPNKTFNLPDDNNRFKIGTYGVNSRKKLKGKKYWKDSDDDGIPDNIDVDIDGDGYTDNAPDTSLNNDFDGIEDDPDPFNTKDKSKTLMAASFDVGFPLLNYKLFKLNVYGQAASFIPRKVNDYQTGTKFTPGWGIGAPGLKMNIFEIVNLTTEYRLAGKNFLYGFWDRAYDFERVAIRKSDGALLPYTKDEMRLMNESMQGIYNAVDVNILNYIILGSYYQHMFKGGNDVKSFMASATIPSGKIPKLASATAFYQRNNDDNPFDFNNPSENTILGYRIGFEVGGGVVISYIFQKTYRDQNGDGKIDPKKESITLTTIETGINF